MAPDSLIWETPDMSDLPPGSAISRHLGLPHNRLFADLLSRLQLSYDYGRKDRAYRGGYDFFDENQSLREKNAKLVEYNQSAIWKWLNEPGEHDETWEALLGVDMLPADHPRRPEDRPPLKSLRWRPASDAADAPEVPVVQVYSARVARRAGPEGQELDQLVLQIVQRRKAFFDLDKQRKADEEGVPDEPDFWFRGGATLLIDLRSGQLRYTIRKSIRNNQRLARERKFHQDNADPAAAQIYGSAETLETPPEPFALIHRS